VSSTARTLTYSFVPACKLCQFEAISKALETLWTNLLTLKTVNDILPKSFSELSE
jgi:hypothetical protein